MALGKVDKRWPICRTYRHTCAAARQAERWEREMKYECLHRVCSRPRVWRVGRAGVSAYMRVVYCIARAVGVRQCNK